MLIEICKMLTAYLRFDELPMETLPVVTMLHPWNRSMVLSSTTSLVSRPSHSVEGKRRESQTQMETLA